jgi:hypothetical protein
MPDMITVSSSNVTSVGYEDSTQTLYVQFHSGTMYIYKGVPRYEYEGLLNASSVGSYLHRNIKNIFPYERIS